MCCRRLPWAASKCIMDALLAVTSDVWSFLVDGFDWLTTLSAADFVRVFWAFLFLEIPRYAVTDLYVMYLHFTGHYDREIRSFPPESAPLVTAIVAAFNEARTIAYTVRSLSEQDYPNLEIVVVDDGSTDATPAVMESIKTLQSVHYYRLSERQGKSAALNFGLDVSRGTYVVFMDADSTLDRHVVSALLSYFDDPDVAAVGGDLGVRNRDDNLLTRFQGIEYLISLSLSRRFKAAVGILAIVAGAIGAFRRDLLERVGGLEPGPGNDSDLTIRMRKLGKQIAFSGSAICLTTVPASWRKWLKQRLRWDRSVVRNKARKHQDVFRAGLASFRLSNFISFVDTLFFTVVLPLGWLIYVCDILINYSGDYAFVFLTTLMFYVVFTYGRVLVAELVTGRELDWVDFLLVIPVFGLYRLTVKLVRICAVMQEFLFRASYRDPFAPEQVRANMKVY